MTCSPSRSTATPRAREAIDAVAATCASEHIPRGVRRRRRRGARHGQRARSSSTSTTSPTDYTPIVFAFVLGLSFLLLMVAFRSIVVPLKAIVMNLLSVGAAYGLLVLVFQKGSGPSFFGFQQVDDDRGLAAALPLLRPLRPLDGLPRLPAQPDPRALRPDRRQHASRWRSALQSTGRIITGAALIMVAVFGGFAMRRPGDVPADGLRPGVAVLHRRDDRPLGPGPGGMALLGDRNWYLPRWLAWLPDLRAERGDGVASGEDDGPTRAVLWTTRSRRARRGAAVAP